MSLCLDGSGKCCQCQPDDASQPDETRYCRDPIVARVMKWYEENRRTPSAEQQVCYAHETMCRTCNNELGKCVGADKMPPRTAWPTPEQLAAEQQQQGPVKLRFPTMLRKMWSGGEVQQWLDTQALLYTHQQPQHTLNRWNIEQDGDDLLICFNDHEKHEGCEYVRYVPASKHQQPQVQGEQHPDDIAVDRFAAAMKEKLAKKRAQGRGGWEDKSQCSESELSYMLIDHLQKGDPIDIGNFAMMLQQRGERVVIDVLPIWLCDMVEPPEQPRAAVPDVKLYRDMLLWLYEQQMKALVKPIIEFDEWLWKIGNEMTAAPAQPGEGG